MTDAERWATVKSLVGRALDQEPAARVAWLVAQPALEDVRQEALALPPSFRLQRSVAVASASPAGASLRT